MKEARLNEKVGSQAKAFMVAPNLESYAVFLLLWSYSPRFGFLHTGT